MISHLSQLLFLVFLKGCVFTSSAEEISFFGLPFFGSSRQGCRRRMVMVGFRSSALVVRYQDILDCIHAIAVQFKEKSVKQSSKF